MAPGGQPGSCPRLTSVSVSQAGQVELVARLLARVLLEGAKGGSGGLGASPGDQRLLLEAGGEGRGRRGRLQGGALGRWCGGFAGGAAEAEDPLSVFGSEELQDGNGSCSGFRQEAELLTDLRGMFHAGAPPTPFRASSPSSIPL